ncbi:zinc finger protein, partial [Globisporangium splendens]
MPPKKVAGPSKKSVEKKKEKMVEDKTFGLKNKNKSKNVQKYIQEVTKQVKGGNTRADRLKDQQIALKKKPVEDPMKAIFAASITQPKCLVTTARSRCGSEVGVVCLFQGWRVYEDKMETWDQSKLESVVAEKHGEKVAKQTDIVCKHFLDAIERSLYGWFWVCPNGGASCKYRHALPPGYVFKTRAEREAEKSRKVEEISIEEIIEQQRAKLGPHGGTPVTAESLAKWKEDKIKRKKVEEEKRRKEEMKKTGGRGIMSGRALFTFDPTLFRDDADADEDRYSYHDPNEERDDDLDDEEDEEKPAPSLVDAAAAVMDKSLYLQDAEDLDSLKE